jgi:hypothetical protein
MNNNSLNTPQPPPVPSDHPAVWDMVIADMKERDRIGVEKYGVRLRPFDGRDSLVDLYQELLDASVYARKEIHEREYLKLENAILRDALEFYANPEKIAPRGEWSDGYPGGIVYMKGKALYVDTGQIARDALLLCRDSVKKPTQGE